MATRGLVLVQFHANGSRRISPDEKRRRAEKLKLAHQTRWKIKPWPGGRVTDAYPITPRVGVTRFDACAIVEARDRGQLMRIFECVEAHFSHVDGYEA